MTSEGHRRPLILWLAGVGWDEVRGTDSRLVEELSTTATVLWCDPPRRGWTVPLAEMARPFDAVAPNVLRIRVPALPWSSRYGVRVVTAAQTRAAVRRALQALDVVPDLQVVASPIQRFVPGVGGTKVYYQTDDWLGGASLMGLSPSFVSRNIRANCWEADVVGAVTEVLLHEVMGAHAPVRPETRLQVLANGCYEIAPVAGPSERDAVAGLVGQLNERLDLEALGALAEAQVPLRVIGPRTEKDPAFGRRLDTVLSAPSVEYLGPVPADAVPGHLARLGVGLTPYDLTPFNRASFPLKSLEYLAGGLAVVSTDLPAVAWLGTDLISVARSPEEFAVRTRHAIATRGTDEAEMDRRAFAAGHTWARRADDLLDLTVVRGWSRHG
ncbi:glycosyltransferase [Citricoccus sp.]|uniref:glycosyltransferase n=1 Tax=Citricoccus sp. TaxID=1978372 RepID=UPI0028BD707F|nr:glycosyltransferase [Citricoccus sp.]